MVKSRKALLKELKEIKENEKGLAKRNPFVIASKDKQRKKRISELKSLETNLYHKKANNEEDYLKMKEEAKKISVERRKLENKHLYRDEIKKTAQETVLRSARALRSEVETIGKKRLSAKRMEAIIRPTFSRRERRLKYRPMASNILLANSY